MMNKVTKCGLLSIVILMVATLGFVWVASADIIYINNASEWIEHISDFNSDENTIVLTGDIDFSDKSGYVVSKASANIEGYYDGRCHVISNFSIEGTSVSTGLIKVYTGSKISNITLRDFSITSTTHSVGGLVGDLSPSSNTLIENVHVENGSISTSGGKASGGLVGYVHDNGVVTFCKCEVVNSTIYAKSYYVGGLVGWATSVTIIYDHCRVAYCSVNAPSYDVGGIIGLSNNGCSHNVESCIVESCWLYSGYKVGGLVSTVSSTNMVCLKNSSVSNCVLCTETGYSGGCIGDNEAVSVSSTVYNCTVDNCVIYSILGTSGRDCGGIIGGNSASALSPSISDCIVEYCTIVAGNVNNAGGIAGSFPEEGKLDGNRVVCCCIASKKGNAAGICSAVA